MASKLHCLWSDRRGVAAMELSLVFLLLIGLLLPIVDLGVAAIQFIGAYQAMRDLGIYAQYHVPPDVTVAWTPPAISGYSISTTLKCGDTVTACSTGNTASPKWFAFSTTVTVNPLFLTSLLCPGGNCQYPLTYSERFQ